MLPTTSCPGLHTPPYAGVPNGAVARHDQRRGRDGGAWSSPRIVFPYASDPSLAASRRPSFWGHLVHHHQPRESGPLVLLTHAEKVFRRSLALAAEVRELRHLVLLRPLAHAFDPFHPSPRLTIRPGRVLLRSHRAPWRRDPTSVPTIPFTFSSKGNRPFDTPILSRWLPFLSALSLAFAAPGCHPNTTVPGSRARYSTAPPRSSERFDGSNGSAQMGP